jgi:hypothetical protein
MTRPTRAVLLIGVPFGFAGLLWLHPMIGDYEGLRDVTTRFQAVHVAMVLAIPLLAAGIYVLGWLCFAVAGWMVLRARHAADADPATPAVPAAA